MTLRKAVLALVVAALAVPAYAVELHGYMRSGIGGNSAGTSQTCYGLGPIGHKFRLGNECETYGELEFGQTLFRDKESGVTFKFVGMLNFKSTQSQDYESLKTDSSPNDIGLRQSWIGATLPQYGNVTVWAGKRYYMRNDVHIVDWYYWDVSGPGAGVENIDLGFGKLHLAVFQSKSGDSYGYTQPTIWRPDIRLTGISVNPNGSLELGLDLYYLSQPKGQGSDAQKFSPWLTLQHIQTDLFGGFNKIAFQYATGTAAPMTAYPAGGNTDKSKQWRFVETFVFNPTSEWSGMFFASYADKTRMYGSDDKTNHWSNSTQYEFGIRPEYHFNQNIALAVEGGYQASTSKAKAANAGNGDPKETISLWKVAIAPTITPSPSPGGWFFTRPQLRLFVAYNSYDKANPSWIYNDGIMNSNVGTTLADGSALTFGAQVEAWW